MTRRPYNNCDYLKCTIFNFYFMDFQIDIQVTLPNIVFFTVKSPSVTQRSVSQEHNFGKSKTPSASQNYMLIVMCQQHTINGPSIIGNRVHWYHMPTVCAWAYDYRKIIPVLTAHNWKIAQNGVNALRLHTRTLCKNDTHTVKTV